MASEVGRNPGRVEIWKVSGGSDQGYQMQLMGSTRRAPRIYGQIRLHGGLGTLTSAISVDRFGLVLRENGKSEPSLD